MPYYSKFGTSSADVTERTTAIANRSGPLKAFPRTELGLPQQRTIPVLVQHHSHIRLLHQAKSGAVAARDSRTGEPFSEAIIKERHA